MNRGGVVRLPYVIRPDCCGGWCCAQACMRGRGCAGGDDIDPDFVGRPTMNRRCRLEHALSPWIAFMVVPLFGFANAGVSLGGQGLQTLTNRWSSQSRPCSSAKRAACSPVALAVKLGWAERPGRASWTQLYGDAARRDRLHDLFIGGLAFVDPVLIDCGSRSAC